MVNLDKVKISFKIKYSGKREREEIVQYQDLFLFNKTFNI